MAYAVAPWSPGAGQHLLEMLSPEERLILPALQSISTVLVMYRRMLSLSLRRLLMSPSPTYTVYTPATTSCAPHVLRQSPLQCVSLRPVRQQEPAKLFPTCNAHSPHLVSDQSMVKSTWSRFSASGTAHSAPLH